MAWLNSDDKYTPWTFSVIAEIFSMFPEIEWLSSTYPLSWDTKGKAVRSRFVCGYGRRLFYRGANLPSGAWYTRSWIQQESTFWRRSLWESSGGFIDSSLQLAADFELWVRFFQYAELYGVSTPLGGFRHHGNQRSRNQMKAYLAEAENTLHRYGGCPFGKLESMLRRKLYSFFGNRSLSGLPLFIGSLLTRMGILEPVKICMWEDEWKIVTDYVF